jgi:hypothetical protein
LEGSSGLMAGLKLGLNLEFAPEGLQN